MPVASHLAGRLIGKGGTNIKALERMATLSGEVPVRLRYVNTDASVHITAPSAASLESARTVLTRWLSENMNQNLLIDVPLLVEKLQVPERYPHKADAFKS